ncbi:MAG TPA: hypothetical protein VIR57_18200, partial [Chloroflexota bacterium]
MRGLTEPNIQARFDPRSGALLACNQSHPEWVRSFGCLGAKAARWETSLDFSQVYEPTSML